MEIFSKLLTETDIKARLTVPTDALAHINIPGGGNKVDLSPMDSDGNRWPFRCYTRLNGHPKPAFTTGWLDFVRAKGLQIGDKVTFSRLEDEAGGAPQYRIHASRLRAITLMGAEVEDTEFKTTQNEAATTKKKEEALEELKRMVIGERVATRRRRRRQWWR
ncbi:hypothetical protein EZV62_006190 [Acer yangbiense]|uniref:TF-B3 domain-containing protein n=1 Tax=Acer yangbiense TaxID=1000413 RepID=A0A5C7IPT4_9ROSI|nr:hypothetical protein EZV62_006190 [Acer yangbiense]